MIWYLFWFWQLLWKEQMLWCHWRIATQLHGFNVSYNEYHFENMSILFFFFSFFFCCFVFLFARLHLAQLYTFTYTWMFQCVSDMELISLLGFHAPFAIHVIFVHIWVLGFYLTYLVSKLLLPLDFFPTSNVCFNISSNFHLYHTHQ